MDVDIFLDARTENRIKTVPESKGTRRRIQLQDEDDEPKWVHFPSSGNWW